MPTARYSRRAMSPNSWTASVVAERAEADRLGPLREARGRPGGGEVLGKAVPRVGGDRHGDPETRRLREILQPVVPFRLLPRPGCEVDVEVVEVPAGDALLGVVVKRPVRVHEDRRMEHQPGLLLERHAREQFVDALLDGGSAHRRRSSHSGCMTRCGGQLDDLAVGASSCDQPERCYLGCCLWLRIPRLHGERSETCSVIGRSARCNPQAGSLEWPAQVMSLQSLAPLTSRCKRKETRSER